MMIEEDTDMKFKHRVILFAVIGFAMGLISGAVIAPIIVTLQANDGNIHLCAVRFVEAFGGNELTAFVVQALVMGLYGVIPMGGAAFYEYEKWSLTKCTLIHYFSSMICYFLVGFFFRWFRWSNYRGNFVFFICLTAGFFIVWLVNYIVYKIEIARVNKELDIRKQTEK